MTIASEMAERCRQHVARFEPLDNSSELWQWCKSHFAETEINESNLEQMCVNQLSHGFRCNTNIDQNREALIRLACATGVSGIVNPEGGQYNCPQINCEAKNEPEIVEDIEDAIGFDIHRPAFLGGLDTSLMSDRHCQSVWLAYLVTQLFPSRGTSIVEVGAGIGLTAYILMRLGYLDYTTYDLAHAGACHGYFLSRNMPELSIVISGDVKNPLSVQHRNKLKILHASEFASAPVNRFTLMINMDSMTEIPYFDAKQYVDHPCAVNLLSINHEQNSFRVRDIVTAKTLRHRYPFWIRPGYVEEFYSRSE